MSKRRFRRQSGKKAKRSGELAEREFDIAAQEYERFGLIHCQPTYAEFVVTERVKQGANRGQCIGYFRAKGTSDRVMSIAELGGRTCWLEIKHVHNKGKKTIQNTHHQYRQMFEAKRDGNALAFYILRWNNGGDVEWRLYPIETLDVDYHGNEDGIEFVRDSGLLVGGVAYPDWLPVVMDYAKEATV